MFVSAFTREISKTLGVLLIDITMGSKTSLSAFTREISKTLGVLLIDITMGSKTSLSAFFVINYTANYNVLLGRDWIHANLCVTSSIHQFLHFWKGDKVEVVWEDKQHFIAT